MRSIIISCAKTLALIFISTVVLEGQSFDYPAMVQRIQEDVWTNSIGDTSSMNTWVAQQNTDGSWSNYNYGSISPSGSNKHLLRLEQLAKVCTNTNHPKYNNESYKNTIRSGLHFWLNSNNNDPNWWYNEIDWPKRLGIILTLMRAFPDYLSQGNLGVTESEVISLFKPTSINDLSSHGLGANMFDFGLHYIYRGILLEDSMLLVDASNFLEDNLLTNIQSDFSFQDHGPQMHIASYGNEYVKAVVRIAFYLTGTPAAFDINGASFSSFLKFVKEVQIPSIRGQYWDFSVAGRGISRKNATRGNLPHLWYLRDHIDPNDAALYEAALSRMSGNDPPSFNNAAFNRHYWTSDYTHHNRSEFLFTIRSVSTRTVESETGNGESLKAHYLSYGANFIGVNGDEYYNIMPLWDWSMIPGVTARQTTDFPARTPWGSNYGDTDFVGGVSSNNLGAVTLEMGYDGTIARKGWFMFEKEIVCLGNSIESIWADVRTTINQCHGDGAVYYANGGAEVMVGNDPAVQTPANLNWVRHDEVAYFFPENQNVNFTLSDHTGTWQSINNNQSTDPVTGEVFSLWIDHGDSPEEEKYAYVIVPNIPDETAAQNYPLDEIEIIANEDQIQAVYHQGLDIYQIIFYEASTLTHGDFSLSVDIPCVVQVEGDSLISIADPRQNTDVVNVSITIDGGTSVGILNLPDGDFRGSTITENIGDFVSSVKNSSLADKSFMIFPNPSNGFFTIELKESYQEIQVEIFNMAGEKVFQELFDPKNILDIKLEGHPAGMYFVHIKVGGEMVVEKVIKF